jgi:hypothetical protein
MRYLASFGQNVLLASASASRLFAPQHCCFLWDKHSLMEPAHPLRVFRTFQVHPQGCIMYDGEEFRRFANTCIAQANERGLSNHHQAELMQMAAKWLELADDADRMKNLSEAVEAVTGAGTFKFH